MPSPAQPQLPHTKRSDDELKALDLANGFREHDIQALRRLTADELDDQVKARALLWSHLDEIWDYIKDNFKPYHTASDPRYSPVAAMRVLASALESTAVQVKRESEGDLGN